MSVTAETLSILFLLMPGFLASRVLDIAITRKADSAAGRLIEALIFSFLIYAVAQFFFDWTPLVTADVANGQTNYKFTGNHGLVAFVIAASVVVPAITGAFIHHDWHTSFFRALRITDKTSRSSVWQDVYTSQKRHVVVHLRDGRRVYGWPMYVSHDPKDSYIYLFQPAWLTTDGTYIETGTHGILICNDTIRMIEFMKRSNEELRKSAKEST